MAAVAVVGLTLQLTAGRCFTRQVAGLTLLLGTVFALVTAWVTWQWLPPSQAYNGGGEVLATSWTLCAVALAYVLIPFIQAWPTRREGRFYYPDLYRHSWDNFFILLVGGMLTLAYWLLIVLWAMLFEMVGIDFFKTVFFNSVFAWLTLAAVFSLGIHLARKHQQVIGALRHIALSLCFFLLPLTALITLFFGASLPFTGLQPIWDTGYSTPILLCLIGADLLLINGVFQEGSTQPYRGVVCQLVEVAMVLLPVYALIAAYSVYLRVEQYGLTPNRFFLILLVVVATCYALVYAGAVFYRRSEWMGLIRQGNQGVALLMAVLMVLVHSPVLNPLTWSARDQVNRLLTQKISLEEFDFGALKFRFGRAGLQSLEQLKQLPSDHPLAEMLPPWLMAVDEASNYYQWKNNRQSDGLSSVPLVECITGDRPVPPDFVQILTERQCRKSTCYVLPVDLDRDGRDELVFFDMADKWLALKLYDRDPQGEWEKRGTLGAAMTQEQRQALVERIRHEQHSAVESQYQSLQIGDEVLLFEP